VAHIVQVMERADDDFALDVVPPTEHHTPACREASQVMTTIRARPVSPARNAAWSVLGTNGQSGQPVKGELCKHLPDEDSRLRIGEQEIYDAIRVKHVLRAEEGRERVNVRQARRIVLDAAAE
jgi:hypothetical protein